MKHLISVFNLTKDEVDELFRLFTEFKAGRREVLEGDVALLFLESSTRTRLSFEKACRNLSLRTYFAGTKETSLEKGETFYDTIRTLSSLGFKALVFRVPFVLFPYSAYLDEGISLINAGDGTHQHPTQGLLDLYTAMEVYGSVEGLRVLYVGDIAHSRVFRSGSYLFNMYSAKVGVFGPKTLIPEDLKPFGVEMVFDNYEDALSWADLVICLRLQEERFKERYVPSKESYFSQFGLTLERHNKLKGYFMHPGPVNLNVDIDANVVYSEKSLILRQVQNGVYTRMAVLYKALKDD
ncbi:MAG: aspartate carbamoyltransferase catalytic subunit [Hydrogenobacter sp.]